MKIVATEDGAFDQAMLQQMAKRMGADVPTVSARHALSLTQPKGVPAVIKKACEKHIEIRIRHAANSWEQQH